MPHPNDRIKLMEREMKEFKPSDKSSVRETLFDVIEKLNNVGIPSNRIKYKLTKEEFTELGIEIRKDYGYDIVGNNHFAERLDIALRCGNAYVVLMNGTYLGIELDIFNAASE